MKRYLLTSFFVLLLTSAMAQHDPSGFIPKKMPENLKKLNVNVPTKNIPKDTGFGSRGSTIIPIIHYFAHDDKLVYYNGTPLPDSDYRKKVKVVKHFYERYTAPTDIMMSAIPPIRYHHILYISNNGNLYFQAIKMEGADPDNFEEMNMNMIMQPGNAEQAGASNVYIRSNNRVYYRGKELKGINADKFYTIPTEPYSHYIDNPYVSDSTNVYYCGETIEGADAATFQLLKGGLLSKDKNHAYHTYERIDGIDGSTFSSIDYVHYKNKSHVYMLTYNPKCEQVKLLENGAVECDGELYFSLSKARRSSMLNEPKDSVQGPQIAIQSLLYPIQERTVLKQIPADPETFEVVDQDRSSFYTKDKNHVFLNGTIMEGADPSNFYVNRNTGYVTDKSHVFFEGKVVKDADPLTFRRMPSIYKYYDYYRDKSYIYHRGNKVKGLAAENFDIAGFYFKKDGRVWLRVPESNALQFEIEGADPATFQTFDPNYPEIPCSYAKDSKHVYYRGVPIKDADAASFKPQSSTGYAYDKNNLYFNGEKIVQDRPFDSKNFKVIQCSPLSFGADDFYTYDVYAKDQNNLYYNNLVLEDYIPAPGQEPEFYDSGRHHEKFSIFIYCGGRVYCRGKLIKKSHKGSIRMYNYGTYISPFWTDEANIYYEDKLIAPLSEGLKAMDSEYAVIGGNRVYYKDREVEIADIKTFRTDSYGRYAKDKHNVYFEGRALKGISPEDFRALGTGYAKNTKRILYRGKIVDGADPSNTYAELGRRGSLTDRKYVYYQGNRYKLSKD